LGEKGRSLLLLCDFRKPYEMVPKDIKLWHRREELGVPKHLRAFMHRMYEEVKVKIRTSVGIFESFRSDMRVKKGFPLSPTFLVYISTGLRSD